MSSPSESVFTAAVLSPHVTVPLIAAVEAARREVRGEGQSSAMTHSWLLTGPPGSGRSVAAKAFATALVCEDPDVPGCRRCAGCRSAAAGSHPDITWVHTDGVVIQVDEARDLITIAAARPTVAPWRIVVFEDADRFNASSANALLKSIEEPPERTVFVLCAPSTDPEDIAVTLRSRCRHLYVPTPSREEVEAVLLADERLGLSPEQASWAAEVAGGHIGRARHLASEEKARDKRASALKLPALVYEPGEAYRFVTNLVTSATEEVAASVVERDEKELADLRSSLGIGATGRGVVKAQGGTAGQIKELEADQKRRRTRMLRDSLDLALIDIAGMYRDAMMVAAGAVDGEEPVGGFLHPDQAKVSRELARRNAPENLVQCIDAVSACRETLTYNVKPEVALTSMVGRLRECCLQV